LLSKIFNYSKGQYGYRGMEQIQSPLRGYQMEVSRSNGETGAVAGRTVMLRLLRLRTAGANRRRSGCIAAIAMRLFIRAHARAMQHFSQADISRRSNAGATEHYHQQRDYR